MSAPTPPLEQGTHVIVREGATVNIYGDDYTVRGELHGTVESYHSDSESYLIRTGADCIVWASAPDVESNE